MTENNFIKSLSTVGIVLFIAAGILSLVLAILLAKRHIMRLSLRSAWRPHIFIGTGAPNTLRRLIDAKLANVCKIKYEPLLLNSKVQHVASTTPNHYYYRMKAVDSFSKFDEVFQTEMPSAEVRHPNKTVRQYLLDLYPDYLSTPSTDLIHQFADAYDHARHNPDEFKEAQYNHYVHLLEELITCLKDGIRNKTGVIIIKNQQKESQVIFKPEKGGSTHTMAISNSTDMKDKTVSYSNLKL